MAQTAVDAKQRGASARAALHAQFDLLLDAADAPPATLAADGASLLAAWRNVVDAADGTAIHALAPFERSQEWAADGSRSVTTWMTNHLGVARSAAGRIRRTSAVAAELPALGAAARRGSLSEAHLFHLSRARRAPVEAVFDAEQESLVAVAETLDADRLARYLVRWRYAVLESLGTNDEDRPPGDTDEANRLRLVRSFQGRGLLDGELSPEAFATLCEAIDQKLASWRRSGSLTEDPRTLAELHAEALLELVRDGCTPAVTHQAPKPLVLISTSLAALLDRADLIGEDRLAAIAEVLGGGPVGNRTIQRLLCEAGASLVVHDDDGMPLYVGRRHRSATHAQMRALVVRGSGTCEWPGCDVAHQRCHAHHIRGWQHDGPTDLDNLALVCAHHHRAIHERGFVAAFVDGRVQFSAPSGAPVGGRYASHDPP